jgi:hypothetical protein
MYSTVTLYAWLMAPDKGLQVGQASLLTHQQSVSTVILLT